MRKDATCDSLRGGAEATWRVPPYLRGTAVVGKSQITEEKRGGHGEGDPIDLDHGGGGGGNGLGKVFESPIEDLFHSI